MEENYMTKINLRDFYPIYTSDYFIDVPDEIAALIHDFELKEAAFRLSTYRHKAFYSLDMDDGMENDILFVSLSPCEIYERNVTAEQLHAAIAALPDKQAKRVYAYYFSGMSKVKIAQVEGVNKSQITRSINKALKNMEIFLKKSF
jgi:RNA polymerase sigma-70 factor, ECF subfamily